MDNLAAHRTKAVIFLFFALIIFIFKGHALSIRKL